MQLKRFEAPNIQEAFRKIKAELGKDAVIFSTRSVARDGDAPGEGHLDWVEVTAAVERPRPVTSDATRLSRPKVVPQPAPATPAVPVRSLDSYSSPGAPCTPAFCGPALEACYNKLFGAGFHHDTACYLLGRLQSAVSGSESRAARDRQLQQTITQHLPVKGAITIPDGQRKIVAFIGPTGVGKTTTLAKIAAHYACSGRARVKIVTLDTYRIGAVEQLRTYAAIMHLPFAVADSPAELEAVLDTPDESNLILIDTPGRNYRKGEHVNALNDCFNRRFQVERHMLLSATTDEMSLHDLIDRFDQGSLDRMILTKVDESIRQGHLFRFISSARIPVSYITTGQKVPEDICPATPELLSSMMLHGYEQAVH